MIINWIIQVRIRILMFFNVPENIRIFGQNCIDRIKRRKLSGISGKVSNYREYIHNRISSIQCSFNKTSEETIKKKKKVPN